MSQDVEPLGARWNPLEVGVVSLFFCFASVFGGLSFHPPPKKNTNSWNHPRIGGYENGFPVSKGPFSGYMLVFGV